jgi:hypothetical protein
VSDDISERLGDNLKRILSITAGEHCRKYAVRQCVRREHQCPSFSYSRNLMNSSPQFFETWMAAMLNTMRGPGHEQNAKKRVTTYFIRHRVMCPQASFQVSSLRQGFVEGQLTSPIILSEFKFCGPYRQPNWHDR